MCTYYYKGQATTYQISEDGTVYNTKTHRYLKGTTDKDGYIKIHISCPELKVSKVLFLHRMVAETFIPNDNPLKNQVNHIDGNKKNNVVSNLEWVTNKENSEHAWKHNLVQTGKEVFCYDKDKNFIGSFASMGMAAKFLEIHRDTIYRNLDSNPARKACGYYFFTEKKTDFEVDENTKDNNNMHKKPVGKYDLNNILIDTYESVKEASYLNHISDRMVSDCCHGRIKSAKGYIWKFI